MKNLKTLKRLSDVILHHINRFMNILNKYQTEKRRTGTIFSFFILPFVLIFLFECMNRRSLLGGFFFLVQNPIAYFCNVLILCSCFSLALLFRKRLCIILIMSVIWSIGAVANFIILFCRVTPLTGNDLRLLTDALDIVGKYLNIFGIAGIVLLLLAVVFLVASLLLLAPSMPKRLALPKALASILGIFAITWGCFLLGWQTGAVQKEFTELSKSYLHNGFVYCFSFTTLDVGIGKPDDYSEDTIQQITEVYETENETNLAPVRRATDHPNIVIVQLESFFDVNRLKNFTFSTNPIPNFTRMMESCGSGYLNVPVVGAGTVNTEFEVLTGMNIDDFGAGEYPYKTVMLNKTCETLGYNLKPYGYTIQALHNNDGDFYERNAVYTNMGFDTFTSIEYMHPEAYTPLGWAKDFVLTNEIKNGLTSTEKEDFIFAVSVQGHGSYPKTDDLPYEKHVEVSSNTITDEAYLNQMTYFVNQLYEMDQFIGELLSMLRSHGEDTILVMYGDHMPSLNLSDEDFLSGTIYHTEYFIWNNMGLTFEDRNMEAFELSSTILEAIGISDGAINTYHQNYRRLLKNQQITWDDYLKGLSELEYDLLYGDLLSHNGVNPYHSTLLQMGTHPVLIHNVIPQVTGDFRVFGTNFTHYSKVTVNGDECTTLYYNSGMLKVEDKKLEPGDEVVVWQGNLSCTDPYIYQE